MSSNTPNRHPETVRLTEDIRLLRDELTRQLLEREHLIVTVIPNLEAEYQVKVGGRQSADWKTKNGNQAG